MQEKETPATQPGRKGFHHRKRRRHSNRRVESIAASSQNLQACFGSKWMRRSDGLSRCLGATMQGENQYKKNARAGGMKPQVSAKQSAQHS